MTSRWTPKEAQKLIALFEAIALERQRAEEERLERLRLRRRLASWKPKPKEVP